MSFCPYLRLWRKEIHQSWVRCNPTPTCVMFRAVKCLYQGMGRLRMSQFQLKGCRKTRRRFCLCKPCFQKSQGPSISQGPLYLQTDEEWCMHLMCLCVLCLNEHIKCLTCWNSVASREINFSESKVGYFAALHVGKQNVFGSQVAVNYFVLNVHHSFCYLKKKKKSKRK